MTDEATQDDTGSKEPSPSTPEDDPQQPDPETREPDSRQVEDEDPETGGHGEPRVNVTTQGDVKAGENVQFAENIYNVDGREASTLESFGREHCQTLTESQLAVRVRHLVFEDAEVESHLATLSRQRICLLTGEPNLGKGALALRLAHGIWQASSPPPREVLLIRSLDREVRLNVDRICADRKKYGRRILLFEDAFDLENRDLLDFAADLDPNRLADLRKLLTDQETFILLTSDEAHLPRDTVRGLRRIKVLTAVSAPGEEVLRRGFEEHGRRVSRDWGEEERASARELLDRHAAEILSTLRTLPRVHRFLDEYLLDLATERIALDRALARIDDLSDWLLEDLVDPPEGLAFVVSLALAYAAPPLRAVPWLQFHAVWITVSDYMRRQLKHEERELTPRTLGADGFLLRKARAEVRPKPFPAADTVRFTDSSYIQRLWEVLLGAGRGMTGLLVPLLRELMENGDFYLREPAAQALGRIGQIDPLYLVRPTIRRYARSDKPTHHVALGELFQGALGARHGGGRDESYLAGCLTWLRQDTAGQDPKAAWVRVICIRELGAFDLGLALRELKSLIEEKLEDKASQLSFFHQALRRFEAADRSQVAATGSSSAMDEWHDQVLDKISAALFESDQGRIIAAVRYCIVGLCLVEDPIQVFEELLPWLTGTDRGLAAMLALLFLDGGGIANTLDRNKIQLTSVNRRKGQRRPHFSRILAAATLAGGSLEHLSNFLERVYGATREFPLLFRRRLRSNFRILLKGWAEEAVRYDEPRSVMEDLLAHLLAVRNPELKDEVFGLLQRDRDFLEPGSRLHRLAVRVIAR